MWLEEKGTFSDLTHFECVEAIGHSFEVILDLKCHSSGLELKSCLLVCVLSLVDSTIQLSICCEGKRLGFQS